jgi:hypothetical protein
MESFSRRKQPHPHRRSEFVHDVTRFPSLRVPGPAQTKAKQERRDDDEPPACQEGEGTRPLQQAGEAVQVHHAVRSKWSSQSVLFRSFQAVRTRLLCWPRSRLFAVLLLRDSQLHVLEAEVSLCLRCLEGNPWGWIDAEGLLCLQLSSSLQYEVDKRGRKERHGAHDPLLCSGRSIDRSNGSAVLFDEAGPAPVHSGSLSKIGGSSIVSLLRPSHRSLGSSFLTLSCLLWIAVWPGPPTSCPFLLLVLVLSLLRRQCPF